MTLSNIKHTFIGICLAILCVWSLVIIIFPILAMLFPALLDFLFSFILGETNYAAIGIATLLTLVREAISTALGKIKSAVASVIAFFWNTGHTR